MGLKKNVKVLVSLLLILVLCIQLVPVTDVYAEYEFPMATGNGWFLLDDGSLFLIDDIKNPSIYGEDLTPWFEFKDKITSVHAYTGSSIDNCNSLFEGCKNVTSIDISRLNTSKVEDMYHMFYGCSKLTELNITGIDTSNVTDMESMFNGCRSIVNLDVSGFDTSKVRYLSDMFLLCENVEYLDVSGFNTAKANDMSGMFSYCTKLKKIDVSNFSNASLQTNGNKMIEYCESINEVTVNRAMFYYLKPRLFEIYPTWCDIATGKMYTLAETDSIDWTEKTKTFVSCIAGGEGWYIDNSGCLYITGVIERRSASSLDSTPWYYYKDKITAVVAKKGASIDNCKKLFQNYPKLVSADLKNLDTSSVKDMSYMFQACSELTTLNITGFNTANVEIMNSMFDGCSKLEYVDVRSFNTSKVTSMSFMFSDCLALKNLDVSRFKTSNVTTMYNMFNNCEMLDYLDVKGFDTSKVENMGAMFNNCSKLGRVDVSNFNINKAWNFSNMFGNCNNLLELGINEKLLAKVVGQINDISSTWTNRDSVSKVYKSIGDLLKISEKVYLIKGIFYNIWIGNVPVASSNRLDVLGDGGSVKFYPDIKEYNPDLNGEGLVLDNMRLDKSRYHTTDEGRFCMLYLGRDTSVYLEGDNVINYTFQDDLDGIFIPVDSYVSFWGGGSLTIKVSNNGGRALAASSSTVAIYDKVTLDLTGYNGYYGGFVMGHDVAWLDLYDDSKVYMYGLRTDDDKEGYALLGSEVTVSDNAYLYTEYEWNQPVINTWGATFKVNSPITIRGIKNISGIVNREWTTLPSINAGNGTPHESEYRALEIKANTQKPVVEKSEYGDLNEDGLINAQDIVLLMQYLAGYDLDGVINLDNADLNGDGKVNSTDSVIFKQYAAGYDIVLGK